MAGIEEERTRRRLLALEKESERLRSWVRILGFAMFASLGLSIFATFGPSPLDRAGELSTKVLRTEHLVLEGANGQARGEWRVDEEGNSRLLLLDRQASPRLSLSVLNAGFPGLSLKSGSGQTRAALGLLPDESTSLAFTDGAGVLRTVLGLSRAGAAHLVFADGEGVSRVALGLNGSGEGSVILPEDTASVNGTGGEG
jgi:hypothetical protein